MSSPPRGSRGWAAFSLIGIGLWVGVTVLVGVITDDPTDPGPTLIAFAAGGTLFFGLMFGAVAWTQFRRTPSDPEARSSAWIARVYTLLGISVTALGLAAIWQQAIGGGDPKVFIYPLVAIVVIWAAAVPFTLRKVRENARRHMAREAGALPDSD
jgi:peptidoglycan/LPS O-acetylase OafA/YrhL